MIRNGTRHLLSRDTILTFLESMALRIPEIRIHTTSPIDKKRQFFSIIECRFVKKPVAEIGICDSTISFLDAASRPTLVLSLAEIGELLLQQVAHLILEEAQNDVFLFGFEVRKRGPDQLIVGNPRFSAEL
jgi:hypothetical protein